jgi:hypothetical protein
MHTIVRPIQAPEDVRCLHCHLVYPKTGSGFARGPVGCPACDYVGWISASIPLFEDAPLYRSPSDRRQRYFV